MKRTPLRRTAMKAASRRTYTRTCEQCKDVFRPWDRLQRFCSQRCSGASRVLPPLSCERCGGTRDHKHPDRRFCSRACAAAAATIPRPSCSVCGVTVGLGAKTCIAHHHVLNRRARERVCPTCKGTFAPELSRTLRNAGKYCSKACYNAARSVREAFITVRCEQCGTAFSRTRAAITRRHRSFCSRSCSATYNSGPNSAMYRGGTRQRRGPGWIANRRACRTRDRVCRSCGKTPEQNGQELSVDHVIPWRLFADERMANDLGNLIGLCRSCHARKTSRAEAAYVRGDVLEWRAFLIDVGVDRDSLAVYEDFLLPVGVAA